MKGSEGNARELSHIFPGEGDGYGFILDADKAGRGPGGGGLRESHLKQCDILAVMASQCGR